MVAAKKTKVKSSFTSCTRCTGKQNHYCDLILFEKNIKLFYFLECRRMRKKCIPSDYDETICVYCLKNDKLCCKFKPARTEVEIIRLNTEVKTLKERVTDLEERMDYVENDNRILKKNFLQIRLISDQIKLD
jgi:hypothetical protein